MKSRTTLFELVNSLNKQEAKMIATFLEELSTEHAALQLELFRCIRKARTVDNDAIVSRLDSESLIEYFSYHKGALMNHILVQLRPTVQNILFQTRTNVMNELGKIWALYEKGFEVEAIHLVDSIVNKLDADDDSSLKLLVIQEEYQMLKAASYVDRAKRLEQLVAKRQALLRIIRNEDELDILNDKVFALYETVRQSPQEEYHQVVEQIFENRLLKSENEALSFKSRITYNKAHLYRSSILGDVEGIVKHQERIVALWEGAPNQRANRPFVYKYALINLLNGYWRARQFKHFEKVYKKALKVRVLNKKNEASAFVALSSVWLIYLMNTSKIDEAIDFEKEIQPKLQLSAKYATTGSLLNLRYNLASLLFLTGKYKRALKQFEEIAYQKGNVRDDLKGVSRVLMILCAFEHKDSEFIVSLNQAARRFYRKHSKLGKIRLVVFRCIDQLLNADMYNTKSVLEEALKDVNNLIEYDSTIIGLEEVQIWLESKLQGRPIRQIWEGRNQKVS